MTFDERYRAQRQSGPKLGDIISAVKGAVHPREDRKKRQFCVCFCNKQKIVYHIKTSNQGV